MKKYLCLFILINLAVPGIGSVVNQNVALPYGFIENKGQITDQNNQPNPAVLYLYSGNGLHVQLRKNAFSYEVIKTEKKAKVAALYERLIAEQGKFTQKFFKTPKEDITLFIHRIDISFVGANPNSNIEAFDPAPDYINYYTTGTFEQGVTFVRHYKRVLYKNIYPLIDVEFLLTESSQFKYNFIIHPGGDVNNIQMRFEGALNTNVTPDGNIEVETTSGNFEERIPYSYQLNELQWPVTALFKKVGKNVFGFSISEYNPKQPLVIDPLLWATYYGGSSDEQATGISRDLNDNVLTTGFTRSFSAIATSGAFQVSIGGTEDAFIVKFNATGVRQWATYYGGSSDDVGNDITIDVNNNILVTGFTASSGMATSGAHQTIFSGFTESFISKFNSAGLRQWATYYGGAGMDYGTGIVSDGYGNVIVSGVTFSSNGISTTGAHQANLAGLAEDAFVVKFSSGGVRQWATYYGGTDADYGEGVATDSSGSVFVVGTTRSTTGISFTGIGHQTSFGGTEDAFIVKFNATGVRQWATYYGGAGADGGNKITVDINGRVLVTGYTASVSGIATFGAYQTVFGGLEDAFLVKFNGNGTRQWGTYYGGSAADRGEGITANINSEVFITGTTESTTRIASNGANQATLAGKKDAFVTKFNSTGARQWATYYGGADDDWGKGITPDSSNTVLITGTTASSSSISTSSAHQINSGGGNDAFVTKLYDCSHLFSASSTSPVCEGGNLFFTTPAVGLAGKARYHWTGPNGYDTIAENPFLPNVGLNHTGTFQVIRYDSGSGCFDTTTVNVQVWPKPKAGFTQNSLTQCYNGNSFTFSDTSSISSGSFTRLWKLNNGDTSTAPVFTRSFSNAGTFNIQLLLRSDKNCKDTVTKKITVFPSVNAGFAMSNQSSCASHQYQFTDTSFVSSGSYTRLWKFSDGFTTDTITVSKIYNTGGTYSIKLIVSSDSGCVDSITKTFNLATPFAQPVAGFVQNSLAQCSRGNSFVFTDTSQINAGALSRAWSFGDSTFSSDSSTNKNFSAAGTFTVKLVVTSNNNCRDSLTKTVIVHPQTTIGFSINHSTQCLQNNFLFADTSSLNGGTYTRFWELGDSNTSTLPLITKSYAAGSYAVKLITTTNQGCVDSLQQSITVMPFPKPEVGFLQNNLAQCLAGNGFVLKDTSFISSGTLARTWDFGDGSNSSSDSLIKTYLNAGTYQIRLLVTSDQNCTDSVKKYVTVHPQPKAGYTQNNTTQCLSGNLFLLNDTSTLLSGTLTRNWDLGDNTFSANSSENKSFLSAGTYQIKLIARSDKNCIDSAIKSFTVYPQTTIGFMLSGPSSQCRSGNSFTLNDTSTVSSGTFSRLWLLGDGNTSSNQTVNKSFGSNGTYIIKLITTTNKGCLDSVQKTVMVYPQPIARFSINDSVQCFEEHDFLFTDSSTAASVYNRLWNLGDGNLSTNSSFHKKYIDTGAYVVQLKITDVNNCTDSISKLIRLNQNPQEPHIRATNGTTITCTPAYAYHWFVNNTAIPNSNRQTIPIYINGTYLVKIDSSNGCSNTSYPLEVLFINDGAIKVYPNPNHGKFTVDFNTLQGDKTVKVFDVLGQEIARYYTPLNTLSINLNPEFSKGVYMLEIHSSAGVLVKKVVME